jgi:hypothetical protein
VEQIAASSGMPLSKVERYAGPVLSERDRVLEQVRNSFLSAVGTGRPPCASATRWTSDWPRPPVCGSRP